MQPVAFAVSSQRLTDGRPATPRWLPWVIWAASFGLTAVSVALLALSYQVDLGPRWGPRGFLIVFAVMITTMGLVVSVRRPDNRIGAIYLAAGLLCAVQGFGEEYAAYALLVRGGGLPGGVWWAWLQNWIWVPVVSLYLIYVPLLLPNGRLLSPRWRLVAWYAALATATLAFFFATQPGRLANFYHVVNPLGVGSPDGLWPRLLVLAFGLMVVATLAGAVSLIQRVRQAAAVERQQLKWLAFACVWGAAGMLASVIYGVNKRPSEILVLGSILGMHIATALAILRYRLYDIDVIINRTLVYGLLTAALAGIYLGCVVVLQALTFSLTGQQQSRFVTVLSTLTIAALAAPLRARLQAGIDRRFYRRKYDAARSLARFGQALRDEAHADLTRLTDDILGVVDDALQPTSAFLWVRPTSGKKR